MFQCAGNLCPLAHDLGRRGHEAPLSRRQVHERNSRPRRWAQGRGLLTTATHWRILWKFHVRKESIDDIAAFYRQRRAIAAASTPATQRVI